MLNNLHHVRQTHYMFGNSMSHAKPDTGVPLIAKVILNHLVHINEVLFLMEQQ